MDHFGLIIRFVKPVTLEGGEPLLWYGCDLNFLNIK